jgi:hypothetical protein
MNDRPASAKSMLPRRSYFALRSLRWYLVWVSAFFFVVTFAPILNLLWYLYSLTLPDARIAPLEFSDKVKFAIDARLDLSTRLFQSSLVLLATIWGLVIAKKDEAAILLRDKPELIMLCLATAVLASACYSHVVFVWEMSTVAKSSETAFAGKIPDINNREVAYSFVSQCWTTFGGATIAALTIVSAKILKEP